MSVLTYIADGWLLTVPPHSRRISELYLWPFHMRTLVPFTRASLSWPRYLAMAPTSKHHHTGVRVVLCSAQLCPTGYSVHGIFQARVGCHFLLQGIFPIQGSSPSLYTSCIGRQILYHWATWEGLECRYTVCNTTVDPWEKQRQKCSQRKIKGKMWITTKPLEQKCWPMFLHTEDKKELS